MSMELSLLFVAAALLSPAPQVDAKQVEWTMFMMQELESKKPAKLEGKNGAYEVGLLLEIADKPIPVLKLAAEQYSAKPNDLLEMIHEAVVDRKDNKGASRLGHMLDLSDGQLSIVVAERPLRFGQALNTFCEYYSNACVIDSAIERYGKRDLKPFKKQRLSESQLTELKSKFAKWNGSFAVPAQPNSAPADARLVGSVRSIDAHLAMAAVNKSGAVVYGKASGGTLVIYAHASFRDTAIKVLREDSAKRGYPFIRLKR